MVLTVIGDSKLTLFYYSIGSFFFNLNLNLEINYCFFTEFYLLSETSDDLLALVEDTGV
jgi:hypothetical protein